MKVQKLISKGKVIGGRIYFENVDVYADTGIDLLIRRLLNENKEQESQK